MTVAWGNPSGMPFSDEVTLNQMKEGGEENMGKFICHPYSSRFMASLLSVERSV
jgi:hypothetical protein